MIWAQFVSMRRLFLVDNLDNNCFKPLDLQIGKLQSISPWKRPCPIVIRPHPLTGNQPLSLVLLCGCPLGLSFEGRTLPTKQSHGTTYPQSSLLELGKNFSNWRWYACCSCEPCLHAFFIVGSLRLTVPCEPGFAPTKPILYCNMYYRLCWTILWTQITA